MTPSPLRLARPCLLATNACLIAWAAFSPPGAGADELPRYEFKAGQELSYRLETPQIEWDDKQGGKITEYASTQHWKIYVVRENTDGTWRLAFTSRWSSAATGSSDLFWDGYFGLRADGRLADSGTLAPSLWDITVLFPPLPADSEQFATEWQAISPVDMRTTQAEGL